MTGSLSRPAGRGGFVDQLQQPTLGGRVDSRRDRTAQPQLDFPRRTASSTAWSITIDPRRSTSAPNLASSDASLADTLRCPGRDAYNAEMAPSRTALRNVAIVVRSMPASAAASDWVIGR
jgi:hypothetical protein